MTPKVQAPFRIERVKNVQGFEVFGAVTGGRRLNRKSQSASACGFLGVFRRLLSDIGRELNITVPAPAAYTTHVTRLVDLTSSGK